MALHLRPASFYPDPAPRGFHPVAFSYQTMLPEAGERAGHGEGPWIWGLGEENPHGKVCGLPLQEKPPTIPKYSRLGKGPPHLGPFIRAPSRKS